MPPIIEVKNLCKQFGKVKAVDDISFNIPKGICFGLLGPNGAGKTTTIEMIEGITPHDTGEILYNNQPRRDNFSQEIGIQFQHTALMDYLTVEEVLDLFISFYRNTRPKPELISLCELDEFLDRPANKVSGGQKQRLLLAVALLNNPELVFLDEPTTGLDPQSRRNFWRLVEAIKGEGKTVILTTHYMEEAEQLCDQLVIMDHGKIISEGSPQDLLKQHFGFSFVRMKLEHFDVNRPDLTETISEDDHWVEIQTYSIDKTIANLIKHDLPLDSLQVRNPSLDDLFLKLTGHTLRE